MADEGSVKTPLEALQDTLSRIKEMAHYSQTNLIVRRGQRRLIDLMGKLEWDKSFDYNAERSRR